MSELEQRLHSIRNRIRSAARRAGRPDDSVRLVAVTKTVPARAVREAMDAGVTAFGESRVQEARAKIREIGAGPQWHLVGHLQRNKAGEAARLFRMIHSVDSVPLLQALDRHSAESRQPLDVLVQVDLAGESTKHGVPESEVPALLEAVAGLTSVRVAGLMILPPYHPEPERSRPYFRRLAEMARRLADRKIERVSMNELSMGMSEDFEVAVEEGATLVRIGRALFGERPPAAGKESP